MNSFLTDEPSKRTFVKATVVNGYRKGRKTFVYVVDYLVVPATGTLVPLTDTLSGVVESASWSPFNHCSEIKLKPLTLNEAVYQVTVKWLTEAGWKET